MIDSTKINLIDLINPLWTPSNFVFWEGFLDIVSRATFYSPIVTIGKNDRFLFYRLEEDSSIPFLKLDPDGISEKQFIDLSSRKGRKKVKKSIVFFLKLLKDDPKYFGDKLNDDFFIIIAHVRKRWKNDKYLGMIGANWNKEEGRWYFWFNDFYNKFPAGTLKVIC